MKFPRYYLTLSPPDWNSADLIKAFLSYTTINKPLKDLEDTIKKTLKISNVMATNLGRTALTLGLKAMGLGKGDKVILPTIVCPTVIKAVIKADCSPVLVDVENNLHISVRTLESTKFKNAKAVIVPHLYGLYAPIQEIKDWAKNNGLFLIDDAAQSVGISIDNKYLGTFGDIGIFSFGPYKSLSTPRGGALISNDEKVIERVRKSIKRQESFYWATRRILGNTIKFKFREYYLPIKKKIISKNRKSSSLQNKSIQEQMINETFLLSSLEARLIQSVLTRVFSIIEKRRETVYNVWEMLKEYNRFEFVGENTAPYVKIPIRIKGSLSAREAVNVLNAMYIEAERIYYPLHLYDTYKKFASQSLSKAEEVWEKVFLIPNPVNKSIHRLNRIAQAFEVLSKN